MISHRAPTLAAPQWAEASEVGSGSRARITATLPARQLHPPSPDHPFTMRSLSCHAFSRDGFTSIVPKILEPLRRELGVAHSVHDVLVSQVVLQRARVLSVVGELVARRVPQHVRVDGKRHAGFYPETCEKFP